MNEYLTVALITIAAISSLYLFVRWRYGNGLMSKLFAVFIPSIGILGYLGFALGKLGVRGEIMTVILIAAVSVVVLVVQMIQRMVVAKVQAQADAVTEVVTGLTSASREASASAEEQASAVAQVSSTIEEIHQMSQTTAAHSQEVVESTTDAVSHGKRGLDSVQEVVRVMERFAQTADFVNVVKEVAEQSNLLAVNAGIEAVKAGEAGRGFSVVASEVRNLAEQSKEAASQIREVINQSTQGNRAVHATNTLIAELGQVLQNSSEKARMISGAAVQQSAGIKQVANAMGDLTSGGHRTAQASLQIQQAVDRLDGISRELVHLIHGAAARTRT